MLAGRFERLAERGEEGTVSIDSTGISNGPQDASGVAERQDVAGPLRDSCHREGTCGENRESETKMMVCAHGSPITSNRLRKTAASAATTGSEANRRHRLHQRLCCLNESRLRWA